MKQAGISALNNRSRRRISAALLAGTAMTMVAAPAFAQEAEADQSNENVIVVSGIRGSLAKALDEKRNADSLVEVIQAEDIGKLPDQNLAEVLENITGVQITRTAGVGTGVQIRGSNDNRIEINGVGTVGSGTGRGGISFEDVPASIIAAVEVTKAPTAMTTEGSVGGTINLRTIRPLDLRDPLISFRAQGEYSELSKSVTPRISGSFGQKWDVGDGEMGIVISGNYSKLDATSFRPRVDRDGGLVENNTATVVRGTSTQLPAARPAAQAFDFVGIQFLNQELENFKYETYNISGSLEWAPSDSLKLYFDGFYNDQTRRQESSRVQGSGVSSLLDFSVPTSFETVNFGILDGVQLGSIQVAQKGTLEATLAADDEDPNLRFSSDTGARLTTNTLFRGGAEFESGRFSARAELSRTDSKTTNPNLSTTLNFINPNGFPITRNQNENPTPFAYDFTGGALTFGINSASPTAPTTAQLLDPANVVLDAVTVGNNKTKNDETAARLDMSLELDDLTGFLDSFDIGYRYNKSSTSFDQIRSTFGTGDIRQSPRGTLFADLLVPGKSTFGDFDGRELAFRDFLVVDQGLAYSDQAGTLAKLQAALNSTPTGITRLAAGNPLLRDPVSDPGAFFDISETTNAVYGQLNFEFGPVRGNAGLRYVMTTISSLGNQVTPAGVTPIVTTGKYDELLPRINLTADLSDQLVARASFGKDINRPDFNDLSTSVNFGTGPNNPVAIGNPGLAPETVTSYDASLSWYFAPAAVISVGVFHKKRKNLFVDQLDPPAVDINGFVDITPPCEGGGIYNPIPDRNVLSNIPGNGLCVGKLTKINDTGSTKQTGVEVAFQYDLSSFEDAIGFASGFGLAANYTYQKFSGGEATNDAAPRGRDIFNAINGIYNDNNFVTYSAVQGLLDFSKHAYNVTAFYEKYGISARARYTWRSSFRTNDTAGGATLTSTFGFPVVTAARGQLNGSITYDLTDNINIGVEGVNLTKSKIEQYCVNDGALLCFQGLPDRRLTFGASIKF
ncbi:TonB-dependent receptor [Parasphingorhabdus sp.]|uniref:TonB-dependent receptor n=1 Tax=Parasphingorhabdus sp. TaxID=2709688 RepID=UPI0030B422D0